MNLVAKVHFFYTHYGLRRTIVRVLERLTGLDILGLPRRSPSDGLGTLIVSASDTRTGSSSAKLAAGMALTQDLGVLFDELFEIDLSVELSPAFERGEVLLLGAKAEVFRQPIDPQRADRGRYSIFFDKPLSVSDAGRLQLLVCNRGTTGEIRLGIADQFDCHLTPARQCIIDGHDLRTLANASHGARHDGPLALRIAGRSSSQHANYHRSPVPKRWCEEKLEVGSLYAAGLEEDPLARLKHTLRFREATVDRLNADRPRPKATSLLLLGCHIDAQHARHLVAAAQRRFLPVVGILEAGRKSATEPGPQLSEAQLAQWSDVIFVTREREAERIKSLYAVDVCRAQASSMTEAVGQWLPRYRRRILPRFSIVTILYNKASALGPVLHSYFRQDYEGDFEVVFIDDASPDDSVAVVERTFAEARASGHYKRLPSCKFIRNPANLGNCVSRNVGLAAAEGEILVVIDADCMLNRHFLSRHAQAHSFGDTDVVIGPLNIETENEDPLQCLERLETQPHLAARRTQLQDELNRLSFLNCVTRNFSIRKEAVERELFDPAFTYSADPASGFGWEDVEMGYRLYQRGKRIKYVSDAFSVHISHDPPSPDKQKPVRSARNFRRLFEKHPDLQQEARHWARQTLGTLKDWFSKLELEPSEDLKAVEGLLAQAAESSSKRGHAGSKRLKVLTYRWHVAHQYELYKLGHDFALVRDAGGSMTAAWDLHQRPMPDNARFISKDSINEKDFDLAILHFDENVLSWENTNGVLGEDWGAAFRWFMDNVKLPKVAICHGTPQFYGQYNPSYDMPDLMQVIEPSREKLVEYLGDTLVICNSHQAQKEWAFQRSRVIWHGFDPTELPPATYVRGILSPMGPLVRSRPHYRGYFLYKQVFADFPPEFMPSPLCVPDPSPLYHGNQFATWKYRNYIDEIRRYSIYFNPTLRSPMPRARAEPMMCGVVTVNARNHDVDMFIKNGVNGFYAEEPAELREQLLFLSRNPVAAREIGAAGRRTALDIFNIDRYLGDWREVIQSAV